MAIQQAWPTEQSQPNRHLFTIEEYELMLEAGVFGEDDHIELIRGEIVDMPPIGPGHGFGVSNLVMLLAPKVGKSAILWVQSPVRISPDARPEPDVALLRPRPDLSPGSPPLASDVLLVIEISDSSVAYDRKVKRRLYAEAGIPEYWIVNLQDQIIELYSNPSEGDYRQATQAKRGETLTLPVELGGIQVTDILTNT
jgi:Uma2 family endonuclease